MHRLCSSRTMSQQGGCKRGLETHLHACYAKHAKERNTRARLGEKGRRLRALKGGRPGESLSSHLLSSADRIHRIGSSAIQRGNSSAPNLASITSLRRGGQHEKDEFVPASDCVQPIASCTIRLRHCRTCTHRWNLSHGTASLRNPTSNRRADCRSHAGSRGCLSSQARRRADDLRQQGR